MTEDNVKAKIQDKTGIHRGGAIHPSGYGFWKPAAMAEHTLRTMVSIETKVIQLADSSYPAHSGQRIVMESEDEDGLEAVDGEIRSSRSSMLWSFSSLP
jgi:hypothetical protein